MKANGNAKSLGLSVAMIAVVFLFCPLVFSQTYKPSTIYGEDGRRDFFEIKSAELRSLARKSVALFSSSQVSKAKTNLKILKSNKYGKYYRICPGERFFDQPTMSFCSGVLVSDWHVLTAAHCIQESTCKKTRFVFDYLIDDQWSFDPSAIQVGAEKIFECSKITKRVEKRGLEFALVELDRPVFDRSPIVLGGEVGPTENLITTGYPQGIPLKISTGGRLRYETKNYFVANLDALSGSSGAPVYNNKLEMLGILLRGEEDYEYDRARKCYTEKKCSETTCRGETILKISTILEHLKRPLASNP